jgi:hypothetical protein
MGACVFIGRLVYLLKRPSVARQRLVTVLVVRWLTQSTLADTIDFVECRSFLSLRQKQKKTPDKPGFSFVALA